MSAPRETTIKLHAGLSTSLKSDAAPIPHHERGRYKHIDVRIVHGALKGNFGTILDTHWNKISGNQSGGGLNEYEEIAVVETETQAVKSCHSYWLDELRERQ
jgi:hypothetical protein